MLPSLKEITPREGTSIISKDISLSVEDGFADEAKLLIQNLKEMGYNVTDKGQTVIALCHFPQNMQAKNDEHYRLDVKDNYITISGGTPHAIFNGTQTLVSLLKKQTIPAKLENIAINDYPDLLYRGMMLDIARNFTKKADLFKLINQLAAYKINVLHFHFSDDEAWRLEIPGLEELTAIGSRRGFTEDESQCLYPVYYGGWNPNDTTATANGYYTREDFIEVLQYAAKRHITVIPEIESPGHARAAIKAMEARFNRLKGEDMEKAREYLLSESADTSKYVSAQAYTDNIMNVALPSVYRFMDNDSHRRRRSTQRVLDRFPALPQIHGGKRHERYPRAIGILLGKHHGNAVEKRSENFGLARSRSTPLSRNERPHSSPLRRCILLEHDRQTRCCSLHRSQRRIRRNTLQCQQPLHRFGL